MITFFGGIHFRRMDLYGVKRVWLLLDACGDTLEKLRLHPTDPYGEEFCKLGGGVGELNRPIRRQPGDASASRPVTEQIPSDSRDYGGIH